MSSEASSLIHYQVALTIILVLVSLNLIANLRMLGRAAPRGKGPAATRPTSVLIPARNEARNIRRCLHSLLAQGYPLFEVVVLDDGSSDATAEIVAEMARQDPRLRLVRGQPVTTEKVRLRILKAAACPAIAEMSLFAEAR